jgi:hypothetical protein
MPPVHAIRDVAVAGGYVGSPEHDTARPDRPSATNMDEIVRRCLVDTHADDAAASDNYVIQQQLVYSFAEEFKTKASALAAARQTQGDAFRRCILASDPTSRSTSSRPAFDAWTVTRYSPRG